MRPVHLQQLTTTTSMARRNVRDWERRPAFSSKLIQIVGGRFGTCARAGSCQYHLPVSPMCDTFLPSTALIHWIFLGFSGSGRFLVPQPLTSHRIENPSNCDDTAVHITVLTA